MARRVSNEPDLGTQPGTGLIVPLDLIRVDENKNLRRFAPKAAEIKELAESIKVTGLINPVTVRELTPEESNGNGEKYELIAGYQRIKAFAYLNENGQDFTTIKVEVKEVLPQAGLLLNLDENLKRNALSPIDCAFAAKSLVDSGMQQQEVAKAMHKSGAWVSQTLSLLTLRPEVQRKIHEGKISFVAARDFPNMPEEEQDKLIASAEESGGVVRSGDAKAAREAKGAKKSNRGRKAKGDEATPKGVSAKQAVATVAEIVKEISDQEGKKTKTENAAIEVFEVFGDYLGGKFGGKALKNRVMAAVG